jgi:Icc-related predicted phosphoesterase
MAEIHSPDGKVRLAAVGDLHCTKDSVGLYKPVFAQLEGKADVLLLCGDLTDYGLPDEAHVLAKELATLKIPILAVLGNHDYESGHHEKVIEILREGGVKVLDGDSHVIDDVGFAGVKGFAGGFGRGTLGPWGERAIKVFVQESVNEALKLESALARLKSAHRIALIHYAPVQGTVEGEPIEIYPWLGSSRLEEPLTRYEVSAVVHGHAHRGSPEARTKTGIPVYNVSLPLLRTSYPDQPAFRMIEVPRGGVVAGSIEDRRSHGRRAGDREPPASRVADAPSA